jgi:hypothetical protein
LKETIVNSPDMGLDTSNQFALITPKQIDMNSVQRKIMAKYL